MIDDSLVARYKRQGVLIDTAPLVLLAVGLGNPTAIQRHKRTGSYSEQDFRKLVAFVRRFDSRVATPHILTEADNLARQGVTGQELFRLALAWRAWITDTVEVPIASVLAARDQRFGWLGLADCATVLASENRLVLTADAVLHRTVVQAGRDAVRVDALFDREPRDT